MASPAFGGDGRVSNTAFPIDSIDDLFASGAPNENAVAKPRTGDAWIDEFAPEPVQEKSFSLSSIFSGIFNLFRSNKQSTPYHAQPTNKTLDATSEFAYETKPKNSSRSIWGSLFGRIIGSLASAYQSSRTRNSSYSSNQQTTNYNLPASSLEQRVSTPPRADAARRQIALAYSSPSATLDLSDFAPDVDVPARTRNIVSLVAPEEEFALESVPLPVENSPGDNAYLNQNKEKTQGARKAAVKIAKGVANYMPVIGALTTKERVVEDVVKNAIAIAGGNCTIQGTDLWELMYQGKVNNGMTKKAVLEQLKGFGISIDGVVESSRLIKDNKWVNRFNNIGIGKYKIGNIGDGLQVYRGEEGESKWNTYKRNFRVGGEVSAMYQAASLAGAGIVSTDAGRTALGSASRILQDKLRGTRYEWMIDAIALESALHNGLSHNGAYAAAGKSIGNLYSRTTDLVNRGINRLADRYEQGRESATRLGRYLRGVGKYNNKIGTALKYGSLAASLGGILLAQDGSSDSNIETNVHANVSPDVVLPNDVNMETKVADVINPNMPTQDQIVQLRQNGWNYDPRTQDFTRVVTGNDKSLSDILRKSDAAIGNDAVISAKDSAYAAHDVANTTGSQVRNYDKVFSWDKIKDPTSYQIRPGAKLKAGWATVKEFFN